VQAFFNPKIMEDKNLLDQQINVELPEEIAEGIYSNLAMIAHSNSEFVIDFIRLMPGVPKAKVKSRIIVTPDHAKRLLAALKENIEKYESAFGKISQGGGAPSFPISFGKPGEA
jgi:hypothetical protein